MHSSHNPQTPRKKKHKFVEGTSQIFYRILLQCSKCYVGQTGTKKTHRRGKHSSRLLLMAMVPLQMLVRENASGQWVQRLTQTGRSLFGGSQRPKMSTRTLSERFTGGVNKLKSVRTHILVDAQRPDRSCLVAFAQWVTVRYFLAFCDAATDLYIAELRYVTLSINNSRNWLRKNQSCSVGGIKPAEPPRRVQLSLNLSESLPY